MPRTHSVSPSAGTGLTGLRRAAARTVDLALEATVAGSFGSPGIVARRFGFNWADLPRLDGRTVLITGATSGIGAAAAEAMVRLGADVAIVARDPDRTAAAAESLMRLAPDAAPAGAGGRGAPSPGSRVRWYSADVGSLADCRRLVARVSSDLDHLDVLIHNAGALLAQWSTSPEGFEQTWASHVLGPHVLTSGLLGLLTGGTDPRVITVSSGGMYAEKLEPYRVQMSRGEYDGVRAYARAKRAQVELTRQWAAQVPGPVSFHSMHPGWVDTPGVVQALPRFHAITRPILRTPAQGADTLVWLAAATLAPEHNGGFWLDRRRRSTTRLPWTVTPPGAGEALWDRVCREAGADPRPAR